MRTELLSYELGKTAGPIGSRPIDLGTFEGDIPMRSQPTTPKLIDLCSSSLGASNRYRGSLPLHHQEV